MPIPRASEKQRKKTHENKNKINYFTIGKKRNSYIYIYEYIIMYRHDA